MFTTRPEIQGTFGVVTSTHWLASAAGMAVLERGGNAYDAAVATGFALQVVEPHLNGPGGEVPIIHRDAGSREIQVVCGQGTAPRHATIEHYRREGLALVPGNGLLATVIPGAFDAWMQLLRDRGTLKPRDVLAHAIGYAREGYPLVATVSATIGRVAEFLQAAWPTSAALYLPDGSVPQPGTLFRNTALARTYERLVAAGEAAGEDRERQIEAMRRAWRQGFVAEAIDAFCRKEIMDSSGQPHRGVLDGDDLAGWEASVEAPVGLEYAGVTVYKAGPWSQGPVFLQQLALLKGFDLAAMDPLGADFVHTVVECAKLALADREAFYGDPNFVEVPLATLLSDGYNDRRRRLVETKASLEIRPGEIDGFAGRVITSETGAQDPAGLAGEPTTGSAGAVESRIERDTCHLDIIDRHGNMVSATPSGGWLQSSPVIPELGFCLNSRAQMFWLEDGHPATLRPGKRPRTTLSVSLVCREDDPLMVFGTPGGDYQDQWSLVFFLRHLHHGLDLQAAIDAPTFHTDHMPSSFWPREAHPGSLSLEDRFSDAAAETLRRRGHALNFAGPWSLGRLTAARRDGRLLRAAANPRFMQGYALGR